MLWLLNHAIQCRVHGSTASSSWGSVGAVAVAKMPGMLWSRVHDNLADVVMM